jgi:hypothetical protein
VDPFAPPDSDQVLPPSDDDASASVGAWTLVWTLVAMKIITIVIVAVIARRAEAGTLFALITWHWLLVLGALLAAPVLFRYRLRRVKARREMLMRSEWMVEDEVSAVVPRHNARVR